MIWQHGTIYYKSKKLFDFDDTIHFLVTNGLELYMPDYYRSIGLAGLICTVDDQGDSYGLTYEQAKEEALTKDSLFIKLIWDRGENICIGWRMRFEGGLFVQRFFFDELDKEEFDDAVRIIFDFFLSELTKSTLIGMYIDKEDKTEEFDWSHFFIDDQAKLEILPDTVCVRREKLDHVNVSEGYIVQPLGHDFYVITNDPAVLCRLPLG
ncbi:MAG: hypothetical protein Q6M04_09705 [Thermostichus sp. BF3_bins_97]